MRFRGHRPFCADRDDNIFSYPTRRDAPDVTLDSKTNPRRECSPCRNSEYKYSSLLQEYGRTGFHSFSPNLWGQASESDRGPVTHSRLILIQISLSRYCVLCIRFSAVTQPQLCSVVTRSQIPDRFIERSVPGDEKSTPPRQSL